MPPNPYLAYNFLVKWDGNYVAAVTSVSGLTRGPVVSIHPGGHPQSTSKIPGQTDYQPVRLRRGITTDSGFEDWANLTGYSPNTPILGSEPPPAEFRKPMEIELHDQHGIIAVRYKLYACWPSEYTALPGPDGEPNTVGLATMTIEHEGWDRDTTVTYTSPAAPTS